MGISKNTLGFVPQKHATEPVGTPFFQFAEVVFERWSFDAMFGGCGKYLFLGFLLRGPP